MTTTEKPWTLYEHSDGRRAAVADPSLADFAVGDPSWHRAGQIDIVRAAASPTLPTMTRPHPHVEMSVAAAEGHIESEIWTGEIVDRERRAAGNCWKDEADAQAFHLAKLKALRESKP